MNVSDEDLVALRQRRRDLISQYGAKGQLHPYARMMGGLNPAAMELLAVRRKIKAAEAERRGPRPVLTFKYGRKSEKDAGGLIYDVSYEFVRGMIGRSEGGGEHLFYVVVDDEIVLKGLKTSGKAAAAFKKWVDERAKR